MRRRILKDGSDQSVFRSRFNVRLWVELCIKWGTYPSGKVDGFAVCCAKKALVFAVV